MDHYKVLEFSAAVRGYHYYKSLWNPIPNQKLECSHEEKNPFDMFAIKVCDDIKIVGHLPMEISRPTKYLMDRGAVFTVELTSTNYRRSPLIQGGLEIPVKVTVTMPGTVKNHLLIEKYKEIVNERYAEPKNEEILGSFLALPPVRQMRRAEQSTKVGKKTKEKQGQGQGQDIRNFFGKITENNKKKDDEIDMVIEKEEKKTNPVTITID